MVYLINSADRESYKSKLFEVARGFGITLDDGKVEKLLKYLALLVKWNKTYNLTALKDLKEMLNRHLVDSLSVAPYIKGSRVLDVGTGPGLPGIPLAIVFPDIKFQLLDSNGKKTRFLTQCKIELGLNNVDVAHCRVEDALFENNFEQITSRAFTSLGNMVSVCSHLLAENGRFLAMKGLEPEQEKEDIPAPFEVKESIQLDVPGCEGQRHLIIIGRSSSVNPVSV